MIAGPLPPPDHPPDEPRQAIEDILSGGDYDLAEPGTLERLQDAVTGWVADFLESLTGTGAGAVVAWIGLAAIVGAAAWALTRFGRTVSGGAGSRASSEMVELSRTPSEWRREADDLERAGRWREGLRARYRAVIADLVAEGTLHDAPGRTSGEYLREAVANRPDLSDALTDVTRRFERAWYGHEPTGADERDAFVAAASRIAGVRR